MLHSCCTFLLVMPTGWSTETFEVLAIEVLDKSKGNGESLRLVCERINDITAYRFL